MPVTPTDPQTDPPFNTRFYWEGQAFNGEVFRCFVVDQQGWTDTPEQVQIAEDFLTIDKGENDDVTDRTIVPTSVSFRLRDENVDLTPLFAGSDKRFKVVIQNEDFDDVFVGYLLTDFYQQDRFDSQPILELQASDGLSSLKDEPFNPDDFANVQFVNERFQDNEYFAPRSLIQQLLPDLGVDTQFVIQWGRKLDREDQDGPKETEPFDDLVLDWLAFPADTWDDVSRFAVLDDVLKTFNLTLEQTVVDNEDDYIALVGTGSDAVWNIMNRWEKYTPDDDTRRSWRYDTNGSLRSSFPTTFLMTSDQEDALIQFGSKSTFERRLNTVATVYEFEDTGNVIENSGFEGVLNLEEEEDDDEFPWLISDAADRIDANEIRQHADNDVTPDPTQENQQYLFSRILQDTDVSPPVLILQQDGIETISNQERSFKVTLEADFGEETGIQMIIGHTMIGKSGGVDWYLQQDHIAIADDYLVSEEDETTIFLKDGLKGPIPKGAVLPVNTDTFAEASSIVMTVEKRAETGDSRLVVTYDEELEEDNQIGYTYWSTDLPELQLQGADYREFDVVTVSSYRPHSNGDWQDYEYAGVFETPDGALIEGPLLFQAYASTNVAPSRTVRQDDIQIEPFADIDRKAYVSKNILEGDDLETVTVADVPLRRQISNKMVGIEDASIGKWGQELTGVRYSTQGSYEDVGRLVSKQLMECFRDHREKISITIQHPTGDASVGDKNEFLRGHEVVIFDGTRWEITRLSTDITQGTQTLDLTELDVDVTDYQTIQVVGDDDTVQRVINS